MTQDILMASEGSVAPADLRAFERRNQMQQFCLLAKDAQGNAILEVIRQVLETPGIFVFGELLVLPNIESLKSSLNKKYYNTLNLFAYGTYKQYRQNLNDYIELSSVMQKKLQLLTIVSLAIAKKYIPYSLLLEELELNNIRQLEDLIIEAIYADIIHGKLFQKNSYLEIDYTQGRDIPPGSTSQVVETLQTWVDSCGAVSNCIEEQINRANIEKLKRLKNKENIEVEVNNLKKVLKTQVAESDEPMQVDSRESLASTSQEVRKKPCKTKNMRPSGSLKFTK